MATGRTNLLDLPLPVQGELSGTWGNTVNNGLTEYLDIAIAGMTSLTSSNFTAGALTINTTEGDASATNIASTSAQYGGIRVSSLAVNSTITVGTSGSNLGRAYRLINDDSTYTLTFKATGQTGVTLQPGQRALVAYNGTDYVVVGTVGPTVTVPYGGTGITSGTSGGIPYFSSTTAIASSAALTANQIVLGGGAGAAPVSSSLLATSAAVTSGTYIKAIGYADTVVALGNTGTAINLDVVSGGVFTATLTGNATITLRYPVSSGSSSFTLILTNDATPSRTVAWAGGSFLFPGGAASLSRTTTANGVDVWVFFTPNGGTTWYGNIAMKAMAA